MKKGIFFTLIIFSSMCIAKNKVVQGISVDNGRMYYFVEKKLFCRDIKTNAVLLEYEPNKDTLLVGQLTRRVIKMQGIKVDTAVETAIERIRNFYVLNLSAYRHRIYIGVSFKTINKTYSNLNYAILEFDDQLLFRNYYVLLRFNYFSMAPFHALQFKDSGTVYMPAIIEDARTMSTGYFEYKMDGEYHVLYKSGKATEQFGFFKNISVMNNRIMDPVIYSVPGSSAGFFYHHPYPILYDKSGNIFDPYQFKLKKDSIYKEHSNNHTGSDYSYTPSFYGSYKLYSNIILATTQIDHTVYLAVSNKDENKMDLLKYDTSSKSHTISTLDISIRDRYFVFSGKILYILDDADGKGLISSIVF